jgi:hypothetical protein
LDWKAWLLFMWTRELADIEQAEVGNAHIPSGIVSASHSLPLSVEKDARTICS